MEPRCPKCYSALIATSASQLRCSKDGTEYEVLFSRNPLPVITAPPPLVPAADGTMPPAPAEPPPPPIAGMHCVQHPNLPAIHQCHSCGAYMCATCDFALPNGYHLCPTCATKPQSNLSPKRRGSMIWSFVCAGGASIGFVFLMIVAASARRSGFDQNALGILMTFCIFIPSVVGLGIGYGAIDRRFQNPPSLWIATIWNSVIVAVFLLLCLVGLMR